VTWLVFTGLATGLAVVAVIFQSPSPATLMFGLVALYGAQAFIAEALGFKTDQTSLTIPRRLLQISPLLVLWRERIRWTDIVDITALPKSLGSERIRVHKSSDGYAFLTFRNRDQKLQFFQTAKQMRPSISIYRTA
jgi:hypothetical protein